MSQRVNQHQEMANVDHVSNFPSDNSSSSQHKQLILDSHLANQFLNQTASTPALKHDHLEVEVVLQPSVLQRELDQTMPSSFDAELVWQRRTARLPLHGLYASVSRPIRPNPENWLDHMPRWFFRLYTAPFPTLYRIQMRWMRICKYLVRAYRVCRVLVKRG